MKIVVWIGRFLRGGFAPGARRNVKALAPFVDKIIVAPLYVLPENHSLYPYVEDFDEEVQDIFKVVNHLPVTDPTADGYYSVCEYDRIPERWVEILNSAKVIMTESHFCKRIFSQQINNAEKIHVIPYILSSDFIHYDPNGHIFRPQNTKKDDFLFGSVFEWVPRKVPERTIKAFLKEFDPSEKVKLVFRTELPESKEMLKKLLGNHYNEFKTAVKQKRIIIIQKRIKKIVDFYRGLDAYISATAGEGYGQTLAEALACGLPTIGSNHSGNLDFMSPDNSFLVDVHDWSLVPDEEEANYHWKLPKIYSIQEKMREVFKKYKNKKKDSEIWWAKEIRETLTPEKIGPMIFDVLKEYL